MSTLRHWKSLLLLVLLSFFFSLSFAAENIHKQLENLVSRQFHLNSDHKFTFYDFPIKDKERIIKTEQEITINGLVADKHAFFYEVAFSKEPYHYYVDALLFYKQITGEDDNINKFIEEEQIVQQGIKHQEEETAKLKILLNRLLNHKFHLNTEHNFTFYDFLIKDKERIIKTEQEITINRLIVDKHGFFYEVAFSKEPYHYYTDAFLFYSEVDKEYIDKLTEEEHMLFQRQEAEAKSQEDARLKHEELERLKKEKFKAMINSKIGVKLLPNYKGHNLQKLYMKYFDTLIGKKEFEKTADYQKRLQAINLNDIYAFQLTDRENFHLNYDPDKETLEVEIDAMSVIGIMPKMENIPFIGLITTNKKASSYVGSNSFGAKKMIKKYEANKYGVQVVKNAQPPYTMSLRMPLNEAKKYKANLSALLVCKPYIKDDTLAFMGGYYAEPTFSDPIEISYVASGINIELLEIWLYDSATGKIFYKKIFWE